MENSTAESLSTRSVGIRYGLILSVISIVYFLVLTLSGVNPNDGWNWFGIIFSVIVIFLAHKYFKENGDGFMSYGQGVGIGFWLTLISSAISTVFTYIYVKFVDLTYMDMIKEKQIEAMQEKGMSDEQIDQAMEFAAAFSTPEMILIFGLLGGLFIGMIVVLIVTAITKKQNPEATI